MVRALHAAFRRYLYRRGDLGSLLSFTCYFTPPFLGCLMLFSAQVKGEVCIWFLGCKPLALKMRVMWLRSREGLLACNRVTCLRVREVLEHLRTFLFISGSWKLETCRFWALKPAAKSKTMRVSDNWDFGKGEAKRAHPLCFMLESRNLNKSDMIENLRLLLRFKLYIKPFNF